MVGHLNTVMCNDSSKAETIPGALQSPIQAPSISALQPNFSERLRVYHHTETLANKDSFYSCP